jgi:ABC-type amino acid transport substrate-binding protein
LIVAFIGLMFVRGGTGPGGPTPSPADLLTRIRTAGAIRVAIRPDHPQTRIPGGTFAGFDLDVAEQLAARVALSDDVVVTNATDMLGAPASAWDIALPSEALGDDATSKFAVGTPYYFWADDVIAPASSTATGVSDLDGRTICVIAGSVGQRWLAGEPLGAGQEMRSNPPARPDVRVETDDAACLADIAAGRADAMVGANLSDADLALRPSVRRVGKTPAVVESRGFIAARSGPDPTALVNTLNAAIDSLRTDGTLRRLSSNRFGGQDLSVPPSP